MADLSITQVPIYSMDVESSIKNHVESVSGPYIEGSTQDGTQDSVQVDLSDESLRLNKKDENENNSQKQQLPPQNLAAIQVYLEISALGASWSKKEDDDKTIIPPPL